VRSMNRFCTRMSPFLSHRTWPFRIVHRFVALNRPPRTIEFPEMLLGTNPFLDGAVVLLEDVVQILNRPMAAAVS
jgi:hypothetical protein